MKKVLKINLIFAEVILLILLTSCKKKELPVLTTVAATSITATTAVSGGNITDDGKAGISLRGVCWGTAQKPTITDSHSSDGTGTGVFTSTLTGLNPGTTYNIRAYATNSEGTAYGNQLSFATLGHVPITSTSDPTDVQATSATLNGLVNPNYLSTTVTFEYGLTTTYGSTATATQSPLTGSTSTSVSVNLTGLNPATTYHFRVKTVNSLGTVYGDDKSFTTLGQIPAASTSAATNVQITGATLNGTVNANLLSTTVTFEYGLTTSYGSSATATQSPVTGSTATSVSANVSSLAPGILYHFRVKGVNSLGTTNGNDMTFTTTGQAPEATTFDATNVQSLGATVNASVDANFLTTVVTFEYGLTTSYGSTATATQSPISGDTPTDVSADLSGLTPGGITYHFRVKAVNSLGTIYGDDMTFTTLGQIPYTRIKPATSVTSTSATLNGTVNAYDLTTTVTFEYGLDTSYGSTIIAIQSPVSGNSNLSVSANISGLLPGTLYNCRLKAENAVGTSYSNNGTFTTGTK